MKPDLKNKKTAAVAGSLAGILIVAAILILLNAILKPVNLRCDCTDESATRSPAEPETF